MSVQGIIFSRGSLEIGTINGHAAEMDELGDVSTHAIHLSNGFDHASSPGYVDSPHAVAVENTHANRIENEG